MRSKALVRSGGVTVMMRRKHARHGPRHLLWLRRSECLRLLRTASTCASANWLARWCICGLLFYTDSALAGPSRARDLRWGISCSVYFSLPASSRAILVVSTIFSLLVLMRSKFRRILVTVVVLGVSKLVGQCLCNPVSTKVLDARCTGKRHQSANFVCQRLNPPSFTLQTSSTCWES